MGTERRWDFGLDGSSESEAVSLTVAKRQANKVRGMGFVVRMNRSCKSALPRCSEDLRLGPGGFGRRKGSRRYSAVWPTEDVDCGRREMELSRDEHFVPQGICKSTQARRKKDPCSLRDVGLQRHMWRRHVMLQSCLFSRVYYIPRR